MTTKQIRITAEASSAELLIAALNSPAAANFSIDKLFYRQGADYSPMLSILRCLLIISFVRRIFDRRLASTSPRLQNVVLMQCGDHKNYFNESVIRYTNALYSMRA
jgi:hypothetical protein